ncbi:hypothetical protein DM01DRAFT_1375515 [Hesseltinella vesiculosa]|uniref:Uncharacterized protein n=1 Tax=Hesseltinella vesiculosa TaxID=101127 RepID=A0A1X2GDI1_9FUNG|nr:hypothetical protein DM01DRAFT_1375515 [Hesseltinella vesiculosa]
MKRSSYFPQRTPRRSDTKIAVDASVRAPATIAPNTTTAASPGSSWFTTVWRQQRYHQQRLASTTSSAMMQSNPYHQHLVMPPPSAAISIHSTLGRGRAHKDNNPKLTELATIRVLM